jgi:hypothetical protein
MQRFSSTIKCLLAVLPAVLWTIPAGAQTCTKADIAAVIDATGAELRKLNAAHQPALQSKLRRLAEKRGWAEAEFESKAAELLQDEETRRLDEQATELLGDLDILGDESGNDQRSCSERLQKLKTISAQLVEVSMAKAAHVSARLDAALSGDTAARRPTPQAAKPEQKLSARTETAGERPARPVPEKESTLKAPSALGGWSTDTVRPPPSGEPSALQPVEPPPGLPPRLPSAAEFEFTAEEIRAAGRGFFGSISAGLAGVIEYAFQRYGRPNGYVLGTEGGGALLAGLRFGEGILVTKVAGEQKVYWQGPSVGYDFGLAGSRVMFLVYNLREPNELFARFAGIDGSAYLVGGVGVTFLKKGRLVLAPIRTGLGLRVGANVGYLKFTPKPSINPF